MVMGATQQQQGAGWIYNPTWHRFERWQNGSVVEVFAGEHGYTGDLPQGVTVRPVRPEVEADMFALDRGDQQAIARLGTVHATLNGQGRAGSAARPDSGGTGYNDTVGQPQGYGDNLPQIQANNYRDRTTLGMVTDKDRLDAQEATLRATIAAAHQDPNSYFQRYAIPTAQNAPGAPDPAMYGRMDPEHDRAFTDQAANAVGFAQAARARQLQQIATAFQAQMQSGKALGERAAATQDNADTQNEWVYRTQQLQQNAHTPGQLAAMPGQLEELRHQAQLKDAETRRTTRQIDQSINPALVQQRDMEMRRASLTPEQLAAMGLDANDPTALSYAAPYAAPAYGRGGQYLPPYAEGGIAENDFAARQRRDQEAEQQDAAQRTATSNQIADRNAVQRAREQAEGEAQQHEQAALQAKQLAQQQIDQIRQQLQMHRQDYQRQVQALADQQNSLQQQHDGERAGIAGQAQSIQQQIGILQQRRAGRGLVASGGQTYAG